MELGFIEVNKNWVETCAQNYIKFHQEREDKGKKEAIDYEMNRCWLFKARTEEAALKRHADWFGYKWSKGGLWRIRAEELLVAVKFGATDNITLNVEIVEWLSRYK